MTGKQEAILRVARNLRIAQAVGQVSNTELASACGVAPRTVGKWRQGEVEITVSHLERAAAHLGRDLSWFFVDHKLAEAA